MSAWDVICKNIEVIVNKPVLIVLFFVAVIFAGLTVNGRVRISKKVMQDSIPLVLISLLPFLWIAVLSSHSGWCYWYTYRGFAVTIYALSSICWMVVSNTRGKNCDNRE